VGSYYRDDGQLERARQSLARALAILEDRLGSSSSISVKPLFELASLDLNQGRPEEAERLLRRALAIAVGEWGDDDPGYTACRGGWWPRRILDRRSR